MLQAANAENIDTVTNLAMNLWPNHGHERLQEEMKEIILKKTALVVLCFQDNIPVAFAQCQLRNDYVEGTKTSPVGYLEGIYVCDNYRKKGIASKLLNYCQNWAKENGCVEFASDCEIDNICSYNFHMAVGFIEANRIICFRKRL